MFFLTGAGGDSKQSTGLDDEKWLKRQRLSFDHRDDTSYKEKIYGVCDYTLNILTAVRYKLEKLTMSYHSAHTDPNFIRRRPPVPCPKLPTTSHPKQAKIGNYSYADIEFRPMIVTEEGAFSAPIQDTPCDIKAQDDVTENPAGNLQWDDDLGHFDSEKLYSQGYVNAGSDCEVSQELASQLRETVIADEDYETEKQSFDEDCSSDYIYDTPIDTSSQKEIDLSQLYAKVDFSAKKKKPPRKDSPSSARSEHGNQKETASKKYSGPSDAGNSKFFVGISDEIPDTPPPIPAPYRGK